MSVTSDAVLSLSGVSKHYGTVVALHDVHFAARSGAVHALLGENGAGKTTLMRIAYGLTTPDAGTITLFGRQHPGLNARAARAAGIGMVQQHLSLAPQLTAAENIVLGGRGVFRPAEARARLEQLMASSGLRVPPDALAHELSIVERQRLEILKALARDARLLILDEPTPGLTPSEIDDLLVWVRAFARSGGAVVLVTHKLREALAVADDVTVLRRGKVVAHGGASAFTSEQLAAVMFPDALPGAAAPASRGAAGDTVLEAALVSLGKDGAWQIRDANTALVRSEIVGIAAVEGSGHRALLQAFAGLRRPDAGTLTLPARIAVIPSDRLADAVIPAFSLTENLALRGAGTRRGRLRWPAMRARTAAVVSRFGIRAASVDAPVGSLSGGNQQRLVVGRELEDDVDLVVADNPTRGLDLQAVAFVHAQLRSAAAAGAAVVVHSSDLDELFALATRILVVFHGHVREVAVEPEAVGRAMTGT